MSYIKIQLNLNISTIFLPKSTDSDPFAKVLDLSDKKGLLDFWKRMAVKICLMILSMSNVAKHQTYLERFPTNSMVCKLSFNVFRFHLTEVCRTIIVKLIDQFHT